MKLNAHFKSNGELLVKELSWLAQKGYDLGPEDLAVYWDPDDREGAVTYSGYTETGLSKAEIEETLEGFTPTFGQLWDDGDVAFEDLRDDELELLIKFMTDFSCLEGRELELFQELSKRSGINMVNYFDSDTFMEDSLKKLNPKFKWAIR